MTNEARIEELEKHIVSLEAELIDVRKENSEALGALETVIIALRTQANEAQVGYLMVSGDLAAQADYAVKLREALERCDQFFTTFFSSEGTVDLEGSQIHKRTKQALSLTPTEAMKQVKEKAWEEGIEAGWKAGIKAAQGGETNMFPDQSVDPALLLAELRKKEGV